VPAKWPILHVGLFTPIEPGVGWVFAHYERVGYVLATKPDTVKAEQRGNLYGPGISEITLRAEHRLTGAQLGQDPTGTHCELQVAHTSISDSWPMRPSSSRLRNPAMMIFINSVVGSNGNAGEESPFDLTKRAHDKLPGLRLVHDTTSLSRITGREHRLPDANGNLGH